MAIKTIGFSNTKINVNITGHFISLAQTVATPSDLLPSSSEEEKPL